MNVDKDITQLIVACEDKGYAPAYTASQTRMPSDGCDVFVISDLHISTGKNPNGKYVGTENFFYDSSFSRYLSFIQKELKEKKGILVINGDFIDFLRITATPVSGNEFDEWHTVLSEVGISIPVEDIKSSISERERKFGLKTHDFKSIWRLYKAMKGHAGFFEALAKWLMAGNKVAIIKGNHDLEWIWQGVRNYFRLEMARHVVALSNRNVKDALQTIILPNVVFADTSLLIGEAVYIEHGHQFDRLCRVLEPKLPGNSRELTIPFGSFFNRYFLNQIELKYPYFDNVRPRQNILPLLFRKNFVSGIRVLFIHVPLMLKSIPVNYYKYIFNPFVIYLLPFIALLLWLLLSVLFCLFFKENTAELPVYFIITPGRLLVWGVISFVYLYIISATHLKEPDSLDKYAKELFQGHANYRFVIFGHAHNPDQVEFEGKWFYNSGTWIPVVESSNADIRQDKTYTYIHLRTDASGNYLPDNLKRWNDDAERPEEMVLMQRK